jgi:hypothetical protein
MRIYRALLHLYPASFRREYGVELTALFARRLAATSGLGLLLLWVEAIADVVTNAARLHVELLAQDLRYTLRTLGRSPGFALTTVLVTAIGVGANTAAFSVADYVFLRPLPYEDPDRLVTVWQRLPSYNAFQLSAPNYRDWKAMSQSFDAMGAYHPVDANVVAGDEPERVSGVAVTSEVLPILGVRPMLGRWFTADEERQDAGGRIILSRGLWERAFGADPSVLGRAVLLDGMPHVVVGVMPHTRNATTTGSMPSHG